jgi:hypothetical protein
MSDILIAPHDRLLLFDLVMLQAGTEDPSPSPDSR